MTNRKNYVMLDTAVGAIEAGEKQQDRLEEFTRRVASGEFHKPVADRVLWVCIDGRLGGEMGPCSAAGTFGLAVADDLTVQCYSKGKTLVLADQAITAKLRGKRVRVGGHCAHADGDNCGCGAKDKVGKAYGFIAANPDVIRQQVESQGVNVPDEVHELIVNNAKARTEFPSGKELSDGLKAVAGSDAESVLIGVHAEVVAAINGRDGESLDRGAILQEFGELYQAFNVDPWSFMESALAIMANEDEAALVTIGLLYYNFAVANILCGPNMRVVSVAPAPALVG